MTESNEVTSPPATGNATIDDALLGLADLASAPLSELRHASAMVAALRGFAADGRSNHQDAEAGSFRGTLR